MIIDKKVAVDSAKVPKLGSATLFVTESNELKIKTNENVVLDPMSNAVRATTATSNIVELSAGSTTVYSTGLSTWANRPTAVGNLYKQIRITDLNNALFYSDGTSWRPINGAFVLQQNKEPFKATVPATTFVDITVASTGGGTPKTRISSAGVHGLTTAAVGASIYIVWAGGLAATGMYRINAIASTTSLDIELDYLAGLGTATPTVAGAANLIPIVSATIPGNLLSTYGEIIHDCTVSVVGSTSATRNFITQLATTTFHQQDISNTNVKGRMTTGVKNNGTANNQTQIATEYGFGYGQTNQPNVTGTIDTTVNQVFTLKLGLSVANEVVTVNASTITIRV